MKLKAIIAGFAMLAIPATIITGTAFATLGGQVEGGDIYRVRNVTKSGTFTDPASATKCETVQFKVRIHNPGPNPLKGVKVGATLSSAAATSHSSKVTVTASNADPKTTTDTAAVNLAGSYKISYVAGSTQLLDANNGVLQTLSDGIVGGEVDVPGGVGVSTQQKRFVQFSAKVDCPEPVKPQEPTVACDALKVEKISRTKYRFNATLSSTGREVTAKEVAFKVVGEGVSETITRSINMLPADYEFKKAGNYTVTATATFDVNGKTVTATSDACKAKITIVEEGKPEVPVTPVVPATPAAPEAPKAAAPAVLPSTGPGAILGSLFGTSALGYGVTRYLASRRALRG